jgi:hypothetical protein
LNGQFLSHGLRTELVIKACGVVPKNGPPSCFDRLISGFGFWIMRKFSQVKWLFLGHGIQNGYNKMAFKML